MYHIPVMLKESLDALDIKPEGTYMDATFGGGGHTSAILNVLAGGKVYAFDQDDDAAAQAVARPDLVFTKANFAFAESYLRLYQALPVDGILADLGISSHQIDEPERGFSTRGEGPLDMRMNTGGTLTAAMVLETYTGAELQRVLGMYGEIRNARTLAGALVKARAGKRLATTEDLKRIVTPFAPRGKEYKYLAQVFQAIRIEVNQEMNALEKLLMQSVRMLKPGGRLVVLSYHSLEDRMVKHFFQAGNISGNPEKDLYGNLLRPFEPVYRKPLEAGPEEIRQNPRARSARLRAGVRTAYNPPEPAAGNGRPEPKN
jgi:16S rRNA (cytosine1402-N4)-methyltransferase